MLFKVYRLRRAGRRLVATSRGRQYNAVSLRPVASAARASAIPDLYEPALPLLQEWHCELP